MNKQGIQRVAVLMGGTSTEREISLRSGAAVAKGLREKGYEVQEVDVVDHVLDPTFSCDVAFIALHGEFGEDGQIQKLLAERKIPFTGSDAASSRLCFDKLLSKECFAKAGILTPEYEVINRPELRTLDFPVVVKPIRQGSSVGVHIIQNESEWQAAFEDAVVFDDEVLVETYISGRELTVGIVADQVLPVIEICPPEGFYNYSAKYVDHSTRYLVPAPIDSGIAETCRKLAKHVFDTLACRGLGRVDFRMDKNNNLYVLELNNIPGFTETSLLPKAAGSVGIDFPDLCEMILNTALSL